MYRVKKKKTVVINQKMKVSEISGINFKIASKGKLGRSMGTALCCSVQGSMLEFDCYK